VRDYVSNDIGKVGLIECDRAERSVLLLGEVCIHKAKGSEPQNQGKYYFEINHHWGEIYFPSFPQVGTINEGNPIATVREKVSDINVLCASIAPRCTILRD
jgi:hypothetical protein